MVNKVFFVIAVNDESVWSSEDLDVVPEWLFGVADDTDRADE